MIAAEIRVLSLIATHEVRVNPLLRGDSSVRYLFLKRYLITCIDALTVLQDLFIFVC